MPAEGRDYTRPEVATSEIDGGVAARGAVIGGGRLVKGAIDRVLALVLAVLALPLLVIATLLIVIDDRGPVLHRQERVGRSGRTFGMWKLRTMRISPLDTDGPDGASAAKLPDDPRVTRAGRLLRRFSLDELPQLLNVIGGSMSLVGPRPYLPSELGLIPAGAEFHLSVKPGMTGLWQVSGRADLSLPERIRLDTDYVEHWSLLLDARIMARTIPAVLSGRGAY